MPDGFCGNSGLTHGQCLGLRFDPKTRNSVVVGLNAMVPYLRDLVLAGICRELTGRVPDPRSHAFDFELGEFQGYYEGGGTSNIVATLDKERLICEIGSSANDYKLRAELVVDEEKKLILHSEAPQLSLGFFIEPDTDDAGLMVGLGAFKRLAKSPPLHRSTTSFGTE